MDHSSGARRENILTFEGRAWRWLAWGGFALALLLNLALVRDYSVPGRWADMAAAFPGIDPFRPLGHPIWMGLLSLLAAQQLLPYSLAINLVSALFGAGAVALVAYVAARLPIEKQRWRKKEGEHELAHLWAGWIAAIFAAVSLPVWLTASRGDFFAFDGFLFVLAAALVMRFLHLRQLRDFYLFLLVMSLGAAENPTLLLASPAYVVIWLVLLWGDTRLRWSMLWQAALLLLPGLLLVVGFCAWYAGQPLAGWHEWTSFGAVLQQFFRGYYYEISYSVPRVGWILIAVVNVVPMVVVAMRFLEEYDDLSSRLANYLFRLVLLGLGLITLFNWHGSAWRLTEYQSPVIAPRLITAIWFGHLIGYHIELFWRGRIKLLAPALAVAVMALLLGTAVCTVREINPAAARPMVAMAEAVVQNLHGRQWIYTDGALDSSLRLAAYRHAIPMNLLNNTREYSQQYARYLASLFHQPEEQGAASFGLAALVKSWFANDRSITGQVAFLTAPDLLAGHEYVAVPAGNLFYAAAPGTEAEPVALFEQHEAYWRTLVLPASNVWATPGPMKPSAFFTLRWNSRIANDLGVYLEDHAQPPLAARAYLQALNIWPDNVSAGINLLALAEREQWSDRAQVRTNVMQMVERNQQAIHMRYLAFFCGYVHNPSAYLQEGWIWAESGRSGLAAYKANQAAKLLEEGDAASRLSLAYFQLDRSQPELSKQNFQRVLEQTPDNQPALFGLLQLAMYGGEYKEVEQLLDRLEKLGADPLRLRQERAYLALATGKRAEAQAQFEKITAEKDDAANAWYALALIALEEDNKPLLDRATAKLALARTFVPGCLLLGDLSAHAENWQEARDYLERAHLAEPNHPLVLDRLLRLDYIQRDTKALRDHTAKLMALDPDNPIAQFAASNIHILDENLDLAEVALRRCLEKSDLGLAHNDLAWVLQQKGRYAEALPYAQRAVEMLPNSPNSWDTYATCLAKLNEYDKALAAMEKALEISQGQSPAIILHASDLYLQGANLKALPAMLDTLENMHDKLTPYQQQEYKRILDQLHSTPLPIK